jgi:hypothetical protein
MTTPTRVETLRAMRAARFAARRDLPATACPFDPGGDERDQRLARVWLRTYLELRPPQAGTIAYDG